MPAYWTLIVMIVVMFSGLSDVSRIRRLEAQNQELLSRPPYGVLSPSVSQQSWQRLELLTQRQRPLPTKQNEAVASGDADGSEGDDESA